MDGDTSSEYGIDIFSSAGTPTGAGSPSSRPEIMIGAANTNGKGKDVGLSEDALAHLQSTEQLALLDAMDKLRSYGISELISLPQLVVCGDQSAGKSSVLEAITEVPFPRNEGTCTRFATQIVLRRSEMPKAIVSIIPEPTRPNSERQKLLSFRHKIRDLSELPHLIELASDEMGVVMDGKTGMRKKFSSDVLSVEISGPHQPHLTLVDLPGLIHTSTESKAVGRDGEENTSPSDVQIVKNLVTGYMRESRTIILAIVSAANDYHNQIILDLTKRHDPTGYRSVGIITKPDKLSIGSKTEDDFLRLAQNKEIEFGLGWHVLRNRSFEEKDVSIAERNALEADYFTRGVWRSLPRDSVGITPLRSRLSTLLYNHIKNELPKVLADINTELARVEAALESLGAARETIPEQRNFLATLSVSFQAIVRAGVDGFYEDAFYDDGENTTRVEKLTRRLRANVQRLNTEFAKVMVVVGHAKQVDLGPRMPESRPSSPTGERKKVMDKIVRARAAAAGVKEPEMISYHQAIEWVRPILEVNKGRELQGTFNPLLIGTLFHEQSKKWEAIAKEHLESVNCAVKAFVGLVIRHITNAEVADTILRHHIRGILAARFESAKAELAGMMKSLRSQPITYNHYFILAMQQARIGNDKENFKKKILAARVHATSISDFEGADGIIEIDRQKLLDSLLQDLKYNMEDYACNEVLQNMLAFYKVALKHFIDDTTIQVIERHLLKDLPDILAPITVIKMTDPEVKKIAEESLQTRKMRAYLARQRDGLRLGLETCGSAMPVVDFAHKKGPGEDDSANDEGEYDPELDFPKQMDSSGVSSSESEASAEEENGDEQE